MDFLKTDPILAEMVRQLVVEFQPDKIFLFGSRATGTSVEESDYDILVVVPTLSEKPLRLSQRAHEILSGIPAAKDILFTSRDKFEDRKMIVNTLAEIAFSEGHELYAA